MSNQTPTKLALGTRVRFAQRLTRLHVNEPGPFNRDRWVDRWVPRTIRGEGIVVGYRTRYDGYTRWIGTEEGNEFVRLGHRTVALVATSLYTNPVVVDPADLEVVEVSRG